MQNTDFLNQLTVLFVEDEELAREKLGKILSKLFKEVIPAQNGLDGFEKFRKSSVDLIISDINMPIMDGLEMLKSIREINGEVPIIFTTARNETDNILRAIDLSVSAYIIKPIDTTLLVSKIVDACEKKFVKFQLEEKQNELEKYLEAVDQVALIYKMDGDGKISFANKSLLETSKYTLEELQEVNFDGLIHPDIPKEQLDKTWESLKKGEIWSGNTKFVTKDKEIFYLKNTIFKIFVNNKEEFITIGFSTTKEHLEKREFQKKVIKSIQEFNKKEHSYKKLIEDLVDKNKQLESYISRLKEELEDQKAKTLSRQKQLDHYELQMHNVDEKYHDHMSSKTKEVNEYTKLLNSLKREKIDFLAKIKECEDEIAATKKELALLTETGEQKNKKIHDLNDVIKTLEKKIADLNS